MKWIFFLLIGAFIIACSGDSNDSKTGKSSMEVGQTIFKKHCVLCHGVDGKLGLNGSKDLTVSTLTFEERINQVTNGKGLMTPFKGILTEEEIREVVTYSSTLK